MTLLFECQNCNFAHDEKIEANKPILVECPQCGEKYRVDLTIKKLKKEIYYESNSDG